MKDDMDGMAVSPEAQQAESVGLDAEPKPKVTKLRGELKAGLIGLGAIVFLCILIGIFYAGKKTPPKAQANKGPAGSRVASVSNKDADENIRELQYHAARDAQENGGIPAGLNGSNSPSMTPRTAYEANGAISPNDPAASLNLPPGRIVQNSRSGHAYPNGGGGHSYAGGGSSGMSETERYALREANLSEQARLSGLTSKGGSGGGGSMGLAHSDSPRALGDVLSQELSRLGSAPGAALASAAAAQAGAGGKDDDQNRQSDKYAYLNEARAPRSEPPGVFVSRVKAMTNYEVKAGWDIPATLEQAINSDLPGEVRGIVRQNVYDTATGHYLLIPQGTRVVGRYNSRIAYGQGGMQVVWTRLVYPDGSSIDLGGLNGQDVRGLSGFRDKVDNHYGRLIGDVLLTSAFSAGIQMAVNGGSSSNSNPYSAQSIVASSVGQQMGEFGMEMARRDMNRQPTVKIPIGYRFNIRVQKDLIFDAPYREQGARWSTKR
jgi:type IV secretion system protein VirB10